MKNSGKYLLSGLSNTVRMLPRVALAATLMSGAGEALVNGGGEAFAQVPSDGRIAYVLTWRNYAVYETEESVQCPDGLNLGPREMFAARFPDDGTVRTVMETQL